jgi:hypothetical protein
LKIEKPETFNDDVNVALLKIEFELIFNIPLIVTLFNIVEPETFNDDVNVALLKIEFELTFNIPLIVVSFNRVKPEMFNDEINVALLLNIEFELTFNIPLIVVSFNSVKPETFNDDLNVALLKIELPDTFKLIAFKFEKRVVPFIYPNILVLVLLSPVMASVDEEDKLYNSFFTLVRFMFIAPMGPDHF